MHRIWVIDTIKTFSTEVSIIAVIDGEASRKTYLTLDIFERHRVRSELASYKDPSTHIRMDDSDNKAPYVVAPTDTIDL